MHFVPLLPQQESVRSESSHTYTCGLPVTRWIASSRTASMPTWRQVLAGNIQADLRATGFQVLQKGKDVVMERSSHAAALSSAWEKRSSSQSGSTRVTMCSMSSCAVNKGPAFANEKFPWFTKFYFRLFVSKGCTYKECEGKRRRLHPSTPSHFRFHYADILSRPK